MIAKTAILENLRNLDALYKKAPSQKYGLYYSKLAILELCGWIELSMDDIAHRCASRHLRKAQNLRYLENRIGRIYGFEYDRHFREMLIQLFGMIHFERIETKLNVTVQARLKSALNDLKAIRDAEAHTFVKGATRTIDAPSRTIIRFSDVYSGLKEFEFAIKKLRF